MTGRLPLILLVTVALSAAVGGACSATGSRNSSGGTESGGSGGAGASSGQGGGGGGLIGVGGSGGAGPSVCDASCQTAGGTCMNGVCTIVENPGGVPAASIPALEAGGGVDPAFTWLYPYDETVFPRGLLPPTLQFGGPPPEAMLVHITFSGMDYKGFFGPSNPARVTLSETMWKAITLAAKANDKVKVNVSRIAGGVVASAPQVSWKIAQGSVRGTIYYETYGSQLAGEVGIMKISPGAAQPSVIKTGCGNVCHTASADGSTLVAATTFPFGSASYDLKNNAAAIKVNGDNAFVYGGIYPDGSFVVSSTNYRTWFSEPSRLYSTKTGTQIPTSSWDNFVTNAGMPAFSPDGKWIAFNREDQGGGHTLASMQYDQATNTFSNLQNLTTDPSLYLGWPAFTPDSKGVIYHGGSNAFFETDNYETGDLFIVDSATHIATRLDRLDGYKNGATYLPAQDPNLNFAPTVLPVAVGGYFWTVFTSHRSYGNTLPSQDNNDQNGKLWVAAIDLTQSSGVDPSHPAFYLDGQEASADNLRGFWVLDPCKQDGNACTGGDECCGGYCQPDGNGGFTCSPQSNGCSQELDKCVTAADCCDQPSECINGHCALKVPQ